MNKLVDKSVNLGPKIFAYDVNGNAVGGALADVTIKGV